MGIDKVWGELQAYGHDVALPRLHEYVAPLRQSSVEEAGSFGPHVRLGIDVAHWILHVERKGIDVRSPLQMLIFYRLCRLLALPHITPYFVFDGPATPKVKRGKNSAEYKRYYTTRLEWKRDDIRAMIDAFGFVWFNAPGEAEAELADLNKRGLLDAVLSDDADCFLFGAKVVVRNWSSTLSGNKARKAYQSRVLSSATDDDDDDNDDASSTAASSEDARDPLGVNRISYYSRHEFPKETQQSGGFLLPALLRGGDYDTDGLAKCGIKLAVELTEAGYGERLHVGVVTHLRASEDDGVPTFRTSESAWQAFLQSWRADVQDELVHNRSGKLRSKRPTLARSDGFAELLSTPESLAVVARYVFPAISRRDSLPQPSPSGADIQWVAMLLGLQVCWRRPYTLNSMHNKVFAGHIARTMTVDGGTSGALEEGELADKRTSIAAFFRGDGKACTASRAHVKDNKVLEKTKSVSEVRQPVYLQAILRERRHPSTGLLDEVFVQYNVAPLVELAERGIEAAAVANPKLRLDDDVEKEAAPSRNESTLNDGVVGSTSSAPATPSKSPRKKIYTQYKDGQPAEAWVERAVIAASAEGRKHLERFDAEQKRKQSKSKSSPKKGKAAAAAHDDGRKQTTLSMFYAGTKSVSTRPTAKAAPRKAESSFSTSPAKSASSTSPTKSSSSTSSSKPSSSTPPRALSSPVKPSLLASLQAIAPLNGVRVSPTKRRPMLSLSSDSSSDSSEDRNAALPPPPPSPAAQRRERQQRARQSNEVSKYRPFATSSNIVASADNSVEFVSERLRKGKAAEVGSITISDDEGL